MTALSPVCGQEPSGTERVLAGPCAFNVAGEMMELKAGQRVTVVGESGDEVLIRLTLSDGQSRTVQIPASLLADTPAPPPSAPVAPAVPMGRPVPAFSASGSTPPAVAADTQVGWSQVTFDALPVPAKKPKWFPYDFNPKSEQFEVYIPRNYRPGRPCGLLGWTNPQDGLGAPRRFEALYDEWNLVVVTAARCGNDQPTPRRVGLLTSAALQLAKKMNIDPSRRILSGFAGGGRVSAIGCFVHPEIWSGAICWCGANFYRDYPDSQRANNVHWGFPRAHKIPDAAPLADVAITRAHARFAIVTGTNDTNLADSRDIDAAMKADGFKSLLIVEPDLGHDLGTPETMRDALVYVLGPPPAL